jgi:hypothetical protein
MRHAIAAAVSFQRDLHEAEEKEAEKIILTEGGEIAELTAAEHDAFAAASAPPGDKVELWGGNVRTGCAATGVIGLQVL